MLLNRVAKLDSKEAYKQKSTVRKLISVSTVIAH